MTSANKARQCFEKNRIHVYVSKDDLYINTPENALLCAGMNTKLEALMRETCNIRARNVPDLDVQESLDGHLRCLDVWEKSAFRLNLSQNSRHSAHSTIL
jgi:hypothetical protein